MMPSPSPRHRADTAPGVSSRFGAYPRLCPLLVQCPPHRSTPCLLRSRHPPNRPVSSPPLHSPAPACRGAMGGSRVGYGRFGCRCLACLPHAVALSLSIWFSPISSPSPRAVLLPPHVPAADACGAVRSLWLLPRWSVPIVFKMLPYQCFKILRLFDMARLCGYRGPHRPIPVPPLRPRADCLCPLRRYPSVLCAVIRPAASRSSLRSPDTNGRGGGYWSPICLPDGTTDGSCGLIVVVMRPCRLLAPCVPRIARRRAAPRIADARPFPHGVAARPFPSCPPHAIAPPNRHDGRGAWRGGCLLGVADWMACVG